MVTLLPRVAAACPEAFAAALRAASPWALELLVGSWEAAEAEVGSFGDFYDRVFDPLGDDADEVRQGGEEGLFQIIVKILDDAFEVRRWGKVGHD
jgi:hypothetical protein